MLGRLLPLAKPATAALERSVMAGGNTCSVMNEESHHCVDRHTTHDGDKYKERGLDKDTRRTKMQKAHTVYTAGKQVTSETYVVWMVGVFSRARWSHFHYISLKDSQQQTTKQTTPW